jgi:2-C-methyl-D-erythritol 4-phosphate cytidylyltransferase
MTVAALVVGAGRGERLRASLPGPGPDGVASPASPVPKALVRVAGRTLLAHACRTLAGCEDVRWVVPVVPPGAEAAARDALRGVEPARKLRDPVAGGAARQDSVRAGLAALPSDAELVAVHDAARPFVAPGDVARVVEAARACGAALLAVPIADTVHRVEEGRLVETPSRRGLWAAQTPQVFRVGWLREALDEARALGVQGTDDAALVARLGVVVRVVEGDPANTKITTAADLALAALRLGAGAPAEEGAA